VAAILPPTLVSGIIEPLQPLHSLGSRSIAGALFSKRTFFTVPRLTVSPQNQARVKDPLLNRSEHWQGICEVPHSLESGSFVSDEMGY
jgi:hypothetical protein